MDTSALKKFAQDARRQLLEQVAARMEQVLSADTVEIREKEKAVKELREQIRSSSKGAVIDQVAYTWFNRFCALRYMDINHYTRMGIVSPVEDFTQPEILQEAKLGVIDDSFKVDKQRVFALLNGQLPSSNPQQEAYRLLLVGACNAYHAQMPFLFPKIEDYTELLMPDDLLSENSILHAVRTALDEDACHDVEVIGWLYQYYISERKDEVFAALKKNKKIEAEDIPAATQLFTPHWIVRYLVENSLGRLWMLNHPQSKLVEQMDYYIKPEEPESEFLEINSPEEIKVCDPACGSGHMLTYAFDLLYVIYEEQGYDPVQIPSLILQHNLYGIEIDQRAGDLAAFALMIKAREKDRRFFRRKMEPNICVLENITFSPDELDAYRKKVGHNLFTQDLWFLLGQFEQADNFGSLIRPQVQYPEQMLERLEELGAFDDLLLYSTNQKVKRALKQAEYLFPRYHVVVANPPYMGGKGMNAELKSFAQDQYPDSKSDLFSMFITRNLELVFKLGIVAMITRHTWMFKTTYENFRNKLITNSNIVSMAHLGPRAFDTISGEVVSTTAFTLQENLKGKGVFFRLLDGESEIEKRELFLKNIPKIKKEKHEYIYFATSSDFINIPEKTISYWISERVIQVFKDGIPLGRLYSPKKGLTTGNNDKFIRLWFETNTRDFSLFNGNKWFPMTKGGMFRKWYGNNDYIILWKDKGKALKDFSGSVIRNEKYYLRMGGSWNDAATKAFNLRYIPEGFINNAVGPMIYSKEIDFVLALMNSKISTYILRILSPTMKFEVGLVSLFPVIKLSAKTDETRKALRIVKNDWDSFETSWDFQKNPLITSIHKNKSLPDTVFSWRDHWKIQTQELCQLEVDNNLAIIEAYNLQNELSPDVSISEITLTSNPYYRYTDSSRKKYTVEEREAMLLEDTMKEFISYGVGCMFGRYSLDKPGLILANAGEILENYLRQVPEPIFIPDEDNVIPLLEGEWFEDDIAERFKDFLKVTFGTENYEENLAFLEGAIGKDIRSYLVKDFYNNHVKMYKKRPIYWLFSSPKGSFNALIYMHRYRPDTISVILNDYLLQYREKLAAHKALLETRSISASTSQGEKTKALKEIDKINKILSELKEYEDEILYHLATQQIEIDLDDGVKVNYNKFGKALKKVRGLSQ